MRRVLLARVAVARAHTLDVAVLKVRRTPGPRTPRAEDLLSVLRIPALTWLQRQLGPPRPGAIA